MQYKVGDIVSGIVSGIQPYGAFVSLDYDSSGLIHISEISSGFVRDVNSYFKLGERIEAKVIAVDDDFHHYKLSIKVLKNQSPRQRARGYKKEKLPPMKIGFKTLEDHLANWIEDALLGKE